MKAEEIRSVAHAHTGRDIGDAMTHATNSAEFLLALVNLEVAAQLAELNETIRAIHPEIKLPKDCLDRQCSYYQHYLAYGPADLTHEGFHAAEDNGNKHFKNCSRSQKGDICKVCEGYEKRLRA